MQPLALGISPCPNDTFAFAGLLTRSVDPEGFDWQLELADIEVLNRRLLAGDFDCAKASFAAVLGAGAELVVLPVGAALGFGVGPLLLAASGRPRTIARTARVLLPGAHTTAALLYGLFHPGEGQVEHVHFAEILPALERGAADYGVCIHEGRFTWEGRGLDRIEDLGLRWEHDTRAPLPLGGLLARRRFGPAAAARITRAVRASLAWASEHRDAALAVMREHAAETGSDAILWRHVELYVSAETRVLGPAGRTALERLAALARERGLLPATASPLVVAGE